MLKLSHFPVVLCLGLFTVPVNAQEWPLEKCMEYAAQHNHSLLAKGGSVRAAESGRKDAVAQLMPEIDGTASLDHYWQIPVQAFPGELLGQPAGSFIPVRMGTPWMGNFGVEARLKLVDPAAWQQIRLATLQKQVAQNEWLSLKKALQKNVRMSYYQVQLQQENLEIARSRRQSWQENQRLIALQFEKGLTDKITLNQSQGIVKDREDMLSRAETAFRAALMDLKFWMGYPMDSALSLPAGEINEASLPAATAPFNAEQLPDYQSRELQLRIAAREYRSTLSALYPALSLRAGYSRLGFGESLRFVDRSDWFPSGFVGLQLRVPLLSASRMIHAPRRRKALLQTAEQEFAQYRAEQHRHYLQEELRLGEARQTVRLQEEKVQLAAESEKLALMKIEKGIINMIELKQVQEDLDKAQEQLNTARLELLRHAVELHYLQNNPSE